MRRPRNKARGRKTIWLDWTPAIADLFDLVPSAWAPPSKVRLTSGRDAGTLSARFVDPRGFPTTARLRLEFEGRDAQVVEEALSFDLTLTTEAAR